MKLLKNQDKGIPRVGDLVFGCSIIAIKPCMSLEMCQREYRGITCNGNFAVIKDEGEHLSKVCAFCGSTLDRTYQKRKGV